MALTKTSFSMITGATLNVKDFGAVGNGVADDTAAIQLTINTASDGGSIFFPNGVYLVSEIYFNKTYQNVVFDEAILKANSNNTLDAVVHITRRQCTFWGMFVDGAFKTNYGAAIKWHADSASVYPGFVKLFDLQINDAVVGILYGAFTSPVDAPVSENNVIGYTTRGVIKPLYTNQPNGFLFMSNCVFDCQPYEWDVYVPGYYENTIAVCVQNHQCQLHITNSSFVKATSSLGHGVINRSILSLSNCQAEVAASNFFVGNIVGGSALPYSELHIDGFLNNFWNNGTDAFFECENGSNKIFVNNLKIFKGAGAAGSANAFIDTGASTLITARFSNVLLRNQIVSSLLAPDSLNYYTQSNVRITSSYIEDTANSYDISLSMSDDNAASYYQFQNIAKYTVVSGGAGGTASIVASGASSFANALQLISDGTSITAATLLNIDGSIRINKRALVVEFSMKVVSATQFYGSVTALYYDDAGVFINSQDLGSNGIVGPFTSIAGAQEYVTVSRFLTPPINAAQVSLRFGLGTFASTWRIGNLKVY